MATVPITDGDTRNDFVASAGQTIFPYTFWIKEQTHLDVFVNDVLKTITTDYTVSAVQQVAGANVVFNSGLLVNDKVAVVYEPDVERQTEFATSGTFKATALNLELTYLISLIQFLDTEDKRTMKLSSSSAFTGSVELPEPTTNGSRVINLKADETAFEFGPTIGDISGAASSATAAATSATNAATSETNAATSATNAVTSETNAATSATDAAASAASIVGDAAAAAASAAAALTSENNASTSETNAATSATNASTSETNAATSASNASTSETNAATSATNAATSETNAATSATNAATSETNAAASADIAGNFGAVLSLDTFDGDDATLTFNLTDNPRDQNALIVKVDGVIQTPATDFTTALKVLTFTTAPNAGTDNIVVQNFGGQQAAGTTVFDDDTFGVQNALDNTKITRIDSSGLTTGTTRKIIMADADVDLTNPTFNNITVTGTVDGRDVATDGTKLDGIESGATADQTGAEIKTAYEAEANTNAFTDAEQTKLGALNQGLATTDSPTFAGMSLTGALDMGSNQINLVATPTVGTDGANKDYVDGLIQGVDWKDFVEAATTANVTLSGEQTIDTVLTSASRILVKDQTDGTENGIYVTATGAWTRATDSDTGAEIQNGTVKANAGSVNGGCTFTNTNTGAITLGVTAVTYVNFGDAVSHAALNGLQGGTGTERFHLTQQQHTNTTSLTTAEFAQLANINLTAVSAAQWGFVGAMDQGVATTNLPQFAKIGIGVAAGTHLLEVGDGTADSRVLSRSNAQFGFRAENSAGSGFHMGIASGTGDGVFSNNAGTELMRMLNANGNIGINKTIPTDQLVVRSDTTERGITIEAEPRPRLRFKRVGGSIGSAIIDFVDASDNVDWAINVDSLGFIIEQAGVSRLEIVPGGNIGINSPVPTDQLVVTTDTTERGITIEAEPRPKLTLKRTGGSVGSGMIHWVDETDSIDWAIDVNTTLTSGFVIAEAGIAKFAIAPGGNVLINTLTDTGEELQVNGTIKAASFDGLPSRMRFISSADAVVVNTTTETTLVTTGFSGSSLVFPANTLTVGTKVKLDAMGLISDSGNPAFQIRVKLNSTIIGDTGAGNLGAVSNDHWFVVLEFTVRTVGVSGTIMASGAFLTEQGDHFGMINLGTVTIDTTIVQTLDLTAEWAVASASNTVTAQILEVAQLKVSL